MHEERDRDGDNEDRRVERRPQAPRKARSELPEDDARVRRAREVLESLGVEHGLVNRIVGRIVVLGSDPMDWLVAGLEEGMHAGAETRGAGGLRQREVERLMEGFATELVKLDEVVEVLATFVSRLREASGGRPDHDILH